MKLYSPSWTKEILIHANRFWFYALFLSIVGGIWVLLAPGSGTSKEKQPVTAAAGEKESTTASPSPSPWWVSAQAKRLVIDSCDLLIPGSYLGWIPADSLTVGMTTVASTLLAMGDIWVSAVTS